MSRTMEWAARAEHLRGIPRKIVISAVGAFAKTVASLLNNTSVHNADTLLRLVRSRPPGVPLITVSNHMSTLDDPVMWGFKGFPIFDAKLARWVLAAEDICFKNAVYSYIFRVEEYIRSGECKTGGSRIFKALKKITEERKKKREDINSKEQPSALTSLT